MQVGIQVGTQVIKFHVFLMEVDPKPFKGRSSRA